MQYRPEIDGLRAVAVLPVMLFHAGFGAFSGGFVGVDVFFVLSGYLITSIILAETRAGTFTVLGFYERRMRRILPALYLVLLVTAPLAWLILEPRDLQDTAESMIYVVLFASNILFAEQSGYFDVDAELKPLLHTWSLAVEEQFYLIYPLMLMAIAYFRPRWRVWILTTLALASLAYSEWAILERPAGASFYLLPPRAWELLLGALCALYLDGRGASAQVPWSSISSRASGVLVVAQAMPAIGLGMIVVAIALFDKGTAFPGFNALLPTVGTALIILFASGKTFVGQALQVSLLVGIGKISYSAYLWHYPLFVLARHANVVEPNRTVFVLLTLLSLGLACLSWWLVEQPFRDRQRLGRRLVLGLAATGSAVLVTTGTIGVTSKGLEEHFLASRVSPQEQELYAQIRAHRVERRNADRDRADSCSALRTAVIDDTFKSRFDACADRHGRALIILGDSHAANLFNALQLAATEPFLVGVVRPGCQVYRPRSKRICPLLDFVTFAAEKRQNIRLVVYHQAGSNLVEDDRGQADEQEIFSGKRPFRIRQNEIGQVIDYLRELGGVVDTMWLGPYTEARVSLERLRPAIASGFVIHDQVLEVFAHIEQSIQAKVRERVQNFSYVPFAEVMTIDRNFLLVDGCLTFRDEDHLSRCGQRLVGARLARHLAAEKLLPTPQ